MSRQWSKADRERFDEILERVLASLPKSIHDLLEESPLIVDDAPTDALLKSVGLDPKEDDLCGLHTGTSLTERSVAHSGELPDHIQLFRRGILDEAGGWKTSIDEEGFASGGEASVEDEIRITLLHEIGHHFGLDEEDLFRLGYG